MTDSAAADAMIRHLIARIVDAWNAHDARAYAAPFKPVAEFTNVFGMRATSRVEIEAMHAAVFRTLFRDSHLAVSEIRVRLVRPDVAAGDVRWAMTGARDPQGREWPRRRGLLNLIATRDDAEWSLHSVHNMELLPEEVVATMEALRR